jgi:hypothetical protein
VDAHYPSIANPVREVRKAVSGTLDPARPGAHLREVVEGVLAEVKAEQTKKKELGRRLARGMERKSRYYD